MRLTTFLAEQAEEQEHIAYTDALIGQMRLRRAALAEQAGAVRKEHRIVVAQILRAQAPAAGRRGICAQSQIAIGGARGSPCRDRQAHRTASDDRRRPATRRAVEALARKDDPHRRLVPQLPDRDNRAIRAYLPGHD